MTLFQEALAGKKTKRRPLWIMRQAGRYLPEYRKLRKESSFEELCADPSLATEVTLMPMKRFPLDAAIVFADLMSPIPSLGIPVRFDPGPVLDKPVRSEEEIRALTLPPSAEVGTEVMETLRRVKKELDPSLALLGFGGAPWSLAAYLVQGHGKTGFPQLRALMASRPDLLNELLGKLTKLVAGYLIEQARAGADVVQVFDSWAGLLSRHEFVQHVRPHLQALLEELGRAGVPRILFLQGAPHLVADCLELPMEGLALCWRSDLPAVRKLLPPTIGLQGNLDPAVLLAGPDATRKACRELLERMPARGHVVNLGHGILPETPIDSVHALIETVHGETSS